MTENAGEFVTLSRRPFKSATRLATQHKTIDFGKIIIASEQLRVEMIWCIAVWQARREVQCLSAAIDDCFEKNLHACRVSMEMMTDSPGSPECQQPRAQILSLTGS